jgi:hypothetical protein
MRRRALPLAVALAVLATTAASCLSPTLPLPPPQTESVTSEAGGLWQISGTCLPGAEVIALDVRTGRGVVVEDLANSGVFVVSIAGSPCDSISISQAVGESGSADSGVLLQAYENGVPVDPGACP